MSFDDSAFSIRLLAARRRICLFGECNSRENRLRCPKGQLSICIRVSAFNCYGRGSKTKSEFLKYTRRACNTCDIIAVFTKHFSKDQTRPCI